MRKLIAGPWVGEFGYELFAYQGYLRFLAQSHDYTKIICRKGHEILYKDFADEIEIFEGEIPDRASGGATCRGFQYKDDQEPCETRILPQQTVVPYNWRRGFMDSAKKQIFIPYGKETEGYDLIFHMRTTTKFRQGYKNTFDGWHTIRKVFPELSIACIGSLSQSECLEGTKDLRGLDLRDLVDTLYSSKLIIGASSGPIHLASLCNLTQVTWYGRPLRQRAIARYTDQWNPFGVEVRAHFINKRDWNPPTEGILESIKELL